MPKRISNKTKQVKKTRGRKDSNQIAFATAQKTIEASEDDTRLDRATISAVMRILGARGGKVGGKRRMETMTQEQRTAIASKAARERWAKEKSK